MIDNTYLLDRVKARLMPKDDHFTLAQVFALGKGFSRFHRRLRLADLPRYTGPGRIAIDILVLFKQFICILTSKNTLHIVVDFISHWRLQFIRLPKGHLVLNFMKSDYIFNTKRCSCSSQKIKTARVR